MSSEVSQYAARRPAALREIDSSSLSTGRKMHALCHRWLVRLLQQDPYMPPASARILLAEDDHEMRRLLAWKLRKAGYLVVEARSGAEVLEYLEPVLHGGRCPFHLIVSDIRMPLVDGVEILAGLRDVGCETPFILITAFGDDTAHRRARELGAVRLFDKPFEFDDLCDAVQSAVSDDD